MKQIFYSAAIFWIVFILLSPGLSIADNEIELEGIENRLSTEISLSDLLNYAYVNNPSIIASKEDWKIAIENYNLGKSYPDPQIMSTYYPSPIETRLGPQDWNLTLSQQFPFPGTLSQKGKVLESDEKISKFRLDKSVREITASIIISFHELIYIQKAGHFAQSNFKLVQKLLKISENHYANDKALFYDISKARAQAAQIQYDILLLKELEQSEKSRINTLLNREPHARLGTARDLAFRKVIYGIDEIYELSRDNLEDILIAEEKINQSSQRIKLTKFENLPSFKLGLFYASVGDPDVPTPPPDAGDDAIGIQLGFTIPLWLGKNQSKTSKAFAMKQKARAQKLVVVNKTHARISRLWFKLQNSKRLITLYAKEMIPQSLRSVQTAETWYRQGEGSFSDFLELQATAYNFQISLERAKADYGKTLVKLELLTGVSLDKKIIDKRINDKKRVDEKTITSKGDNGS